MTYELVSIDGYKLPEGGVGLMDDVVNIGDKVRYAQEVQLIKRALGGTLETGASIGPRTRRRAMEVGDRLETLEQLEAATIAAADQQAPLADELPFVAVPLDPQEQPVLSDIHVGTDHYGKLVDATCGHAWREKDWASVKCPMCALTGLVMSIRSRLVSPACDPMTRETLKAMIADLGDVP